MWSIQSAIRQKTNKYTNCIEVLTFSDTTSFIDSLMREIDCPGPNEDRSQCFCPAFLKRPWFVIYEARGQRFFNNQPCRYVVYFDCPLRADLAGIKCGVEFHRPKNSTIVECERAVTPDRLRHRAW